MGYDTTFTGSVHVTPPLSDEEANFLEAFSRTRRMVRENGPYCVEGSGFCGQGHDADIINFNRPPAGQPGLWCQWVPHGLDQIEWDGGEKFYEADEWMQYIIDHFIGPDPIARKAHPDKFGFLQGHSVEGVIEASGEDSGDHWLLVVENSEVTVKRGSIVYE